MVVPKPRGGKPIRASARAIFAGAGTVAAGVAPAGAEARFGEGCQPLRASITRKPTIYATVTCQPWRNQRPTDFASAYMFEIATPADEPNQIIDPPKPTVYASIPQS